MPIMPIIMHMFMPIMMGILCAYYAYDWAYYGHIMGILWEYYAYYSYYVHTMGTCSAYYAYYRNPTITLMIMPIVGILLLRILLRL